MASFDELRAIARKRDNYDPQMAQQKWAAAGDPTRGMRRGPTPGSGGPSRGSRGPSEPLDAAEVQRYRELAARRKAGLQQAPAMQPSGAGGEGSSTLGAIGGAVGGAFMGALDIADKGRQLYQGLAGEVGDAVEGLTEDLPFGVKQLAQGAGNVLNPFRLRGLVDEETGERDTSFDWSEVTKGDMADGFLGRIDWDDNLPGVVRSVVGVVGDLATDPLTYVTAGTAGLAKKGVSGAARAALPAARVTLAQKVATLGDDVVKAVGKETVDQVQKQVGKYGRGALTKKGIKRGGYTADDLAKMGMTDNFQYNFGVGRARVNVPGSQGAAQLSENMKGAVKAWNASTGLATKSRELFNTGFENQMRTAILKGAPDAPTAARGLAVLGRAKGDANRWASESMHEGAILFKKMSPEDAKVVTRWIEAGSIPPGDFGVRVQGVADFLKKSGLALQEAGATFHLRDNYMPHRASKEAKRAALGGDENVKTALQAFDVTKKEAFEKSRAGSGTIDEINAKWRAETGNNYDLLETDARVLVESYIREGQEAFLRAGLTGNEARRLGLVDDMGKALKNGRVEAAIAEQADKNLAGIAEGARKRAKALDAGRKSLQSSRKALTAQVRAGSNKVAKASSEVNRLTKIHATAQTKLDALEAAAEGLRVQLKAASKAEKTRLQKRLNELDGRRPEYKRNLQTARTRLTKRQGVWNDLQAEAKAARLELETHDSIVRTLSEERAKMNSQAVTRTAVDAENKVVKAEAAIVKQREDFVNPKWDDVEAASQTKAWATADANQLNARTSQAIGRMDEWMEEVRNLPGRGSTDGVLAYADQVTNQMRVLKKLLAEHTDTSTLNDVLRLEAQAVEADMTAILAARTKRAIEKAVADPTDESIKKLLKDQIGVLEDVDFQKMIMDQTRDGFERLAREGAGDAQINRFYNEAITKLDEKLDFGDMNTWLNRYMGAQNWWKGQALASPGFLVRNSMGGAFNMYLDNIPVKYAIRFHNYNTKILDEGQEAADAWATKRFGSVEAENLNKAATVSAATGDGQAASEAAGRVLGAPTKKLNVLSSNSAIPSFFRTKSAHIESGLRGGHAYGVLAQGGDYAEALARVEKFHFNYQNLGKGDEAARLVSPFWTFFSRNMALQAQVYAKQPNKITRSYYNFKRNVEDGMGFDEDTEYTPWYMGRGGMNAARTGMSIFGADKGPLSLTPDIPSVRYPGQMAELADGLTSDPLGTLVGNMGPQVKVPYEMLTNKSTFTGNGYKNELEEWDQDTGGTKPRYAPGIMDLPGLRNILNMLPGTEIYDDRLVMQDNIEAGILGSNPYLARAAGISGDTSSNPASGWNAGIGFFGGLGRFNSPSSQDSSRYFENKIALDAAKAVQEEIRLRNLVAMDARD